METSRRSFLKGIVATAAAGEALVRLATPADMAMEVGKPVGVIPTDYLTEPPSMGLPSGHVLFVNIDGEFRPFGIITELIMENDPMDVTMRGDSHRRYVPGLRRVSGRFVCQGPVDMRVIRG